MSPLARTIYETLAFFDAEDIPLALSELRANLLAGEQTGPATLGAIAEALSGELAAIAESRSGFYFLSGRAALVAARLRNYKIGLRRFRKARRVLRWLKFMPYLRAAALSGSQALLNSGEESDIDLFIIAKSGRIWLTRLLVSLYFQLLGQRRYRVHIKNRFCLNHYLCEGQRITEDQNLYTAAEYANLIPVIGEGQLVQFWKQNPWLSDYLSAPLLQEHAPFFGFVFSPWQRICEAVLDWTVAPLFNSLARLYQKRRIQLADYIIVSESQLSFHPGSRGQKVLGKFRAIREKIAA